MKYGFTGTRKGVQRDIILNTLKKLNLKEGDVVITGGCEGVDSQIFHLVEKHYPLIKQIVFIPYNLSKVDTTILTGYHNNTQIATLAEGTTYRDRNTQIVINSDKLIAFWTGVKMFSGTYMTINIAKKNHIPVEIVDVK